MTRISRATTEDFQHLVKIAEQSPFQPTDRVGLASLELHIQERRALLAYHNEEVAGSLLFRSHLWDEMPLYVEHVDVLEKFRGAGIGRILVAGMERISIASGHNVVFSSTGEDNLASQAFHKALGFKVDCAYPLPTQPVRELMLSKLVIPPITIPQDAEIIV